MRDPRSFGTALAPLLLVSTKYRILPWGGLVVATALSAAGCYAHAAVEPAYVETTYVPAHVERYPSYYYEGRTVYLIDNRWYYRQPAGRWVYYRSEPPVLYRQRLTIRQAPPAHVHRAPAPTVHREAPPRDAPPAYYREDGRRVTPRHPQHNPPPPEQKPPEHKKKRYDDRDHRDHDDRDRDGRDDHDHDHHDRDRY
jgi:hypothetical protein